MKSFAFIRKRSSIAQGLIIALVSAVTFVMIVAVGFIYVQARLDARRHLEAKADQTLEYLKSVLIVPLWNYDNNVVETIGRTLMEDRGYHEITIRDSSGRAIFHQVRKGGGGTIDRSASLKFSNNELAGHVSLRISSATLTEQSKQMLYRSMTMLFAIVITIIVCIIFLTRLLFRRPLNELKAVAAAYGSGDYTVHHNDSSYQEFQPMRDVLALMGQRIMEQISELSESRQQYRELVETLNDWIWEIDETGRFTYVSPQIMTILGYEPEELIGKTPFDLMVPDDAKDRRELFEVYRKEHRPIISLEDRYIHRSGRTVILETNAIPFYDGAGSFKGYRGAGHDVTKRREAEAAIRQYSYKLNERNKELRCLYAISELVRRDDITKEQMLAKSAVEISAAYQYPDITGCRITWRDARYSSPGFAETPWMQDRTIFVHGHPVGTIEVSYREERPQAFEGPFLAEERQLLNSVGDVLGRSAERKDREEEREQLIAELSEALSQIKTLSGMLPICAWCKKIRDDSGYWNQIEAYIRDHSEAEFSHSICPECARKFYPDLYKEKEEGGGAKGGGKEKNPQ